MLFSFQNNFVLFVCILVIFSLIDFFWLGILAKKLYFKHLSHIMARKPDLIAAILFYLIYSFGLVSYSVFDLTCKSVLKGWSYTITLIDIAWGILLTLISSSLGYIIAIKLIK